MNIFENINALVGYGLSCGLINEEDSVYTRNRIMEVLKIDDFPAEYICDSVPKTKVSELEKILSEVLDYAADKKLMSDNGIVSRDLFDTKIMSCLVARPSEVQAQFKNLYAKNPKLATDWYYKFSQDTDYIRRYRICKDLKWKTKTDYGDIDITINLSKPEKDPKAIAAARNAVQSGYPACLLCKENEGYAGRINLAARQTHRIIPIELAGTKWGFQYSPYVYYNEHCIVFSYEHTPMKISSHTFECLFDFIKLFPHYTVGSNADLPVVGGSILTHNHFQGGNYEFAMARASVEYKFSVAGFEDVTCGILQWPMSVIRLSSTDTQKIIELSSVILEKWRSYTDEGAFVFAQTDGEPHNTITPIARKRGDLYEMDLVLRNNITTKENPWGVFHPHENLHHIKKENIGLIEVMGLAVLPARLKSEIAELKEAILCKKDISSVESIAKHAQWVSEFIPKYENVSETNIDDILKKEIGLVFAKVLEDAGVFKRTSEGLAAFKKFSDSLSR